MQKRKLINLVDNRFKNYLIIPIGTIFSYASSNPPKGAFILNGQIIYNCSTLFPKFWNWLISESTNNHIRVVTNTVFESELSSCGNCGAFVINVENGSVRLPSITTGFIQGASSNIGNSESAGLPNITGQADIAIGNSATGTSGVRLMGAYYQGAIQSKADYKFGIASGVNWVNEGVTHETGIDFDASRSSSIYGNSNTVQPKSVHYYFCIQVYNATSDISIQDSSYLTSEIQSKAGINLENLTVAGKGVISNTTFELDYNSMISITSLNTIYKADRAGVLYSYCVASSNNKGFMDLRCYLRADGGTIYASITYIYETKNEARTLIIPKNMYYSFNSANTSTSLASFIPFKNSN